ncbi:hypothetical protein GH714_034393 [Hevea brasiliensis]|uniref:leucine--tRNA ligase n=1 Tax=Hevea brasiliensis TaxID=3981 RepID=A0A6A6L393_HEVBR|nr:hypothetical protein GH714_034393 [Hevea brasiliensis]
MLTAFLFNSSAHQFCEMATEGAKSFARRDRLLEIEQKVRGWWDEKDVFRAEPGERRPGPDEKFFGNFPFPYMNGFLHLGHAFSLSKLEFTAAYHRLRGANVLLPFAFHCTAPRIHSYQDGGVAPFPAKLEPLGGKKIFLAAATLRPETMYGQANAWVLPDGKYGAFEINETDVFILTERAALNLAYQNFSRFPQKPSCLLELTDKGTGIVTSVPSDAPDDYMGLHDLRTKPALRAKYGVNDEWVIPFEIVPIINIPEFGDKAAEKVCLDLKIKSQNEKEKLAEAKRLTYLRGFTEGTMIVGEFKGRKVQEAKPLIRAKLIELGEAIMYSEPEKGLCQGLEMNVL